MASGARPAVGISRRGKGERAKRRRERVCFLFFLFYFFPLIFSSSCNNSNIYKGKMFSDSLFKMTSV